MNWTKFSLSSLIGGITYFFLGWLIFGILLMDITAIPENAAAVIQIPDADFKISYMIVSCLLLGALLSYIFMKWAKISTFMGGLKAAALIGVIINLYVGLSMNSMFRMNTLDQILINAVGDAVCFGLTGGIIGWFLGRGK